MEEIVKSSYMALRFWHLVAAIMWPSPDFFWGGASDVKKNKIGKGYIITATHLDDYFVHSIIFFLGCSKFPHFNKQFKTESCRLSFCQFL